MATAADLYNSRANAVLAQRLRLRGEPPSRDQYGGIPLDHPLMKADPHGELDPNRSIIASLLEPDARR